MHYAAERGDVDLVRTLLSLGADPNLRGLIRDGTPLQWARDGDQRAVVDLLDPLTAD